MEDAAPPGFPPRWELATCQQPPPRLRSARAPALRAPRNRTEQKASAQVSEHSVVCVCMSHHHHRSPIFFYFPFFLIYFKFLRLLLLLPLHVEGIKMGISAQRAAAAGLKLNPTPLIAWGGGGGELAFPGDLGERHPPGRGREPKFGKRVRAGWLSPGCWGQRSEAEVARGGRWDIALSQPACEIFLSGWEGVCGIGAFPCLARYLCAYRYLCLYRPA